jgi:hypothetical protein
MLNWTRVFNVANTKSIDAIFSPNLPFASKCFHLVMLWHVSRYTCTCFFCNLPYFTFMTSCSMPSNMLHTPQACNKSKMNITWTQNMSRHAKQKNHEAKDWTKGKNCSKVKAQLGYPLWNTKDSLLGHPNLPFSSLFLWPISNLPFIFMSNEIILFQILYRHLEYLLFSLMKIRIVKFIQCGSCSINGPNFP